MCGIFGYIGAGKNAKSIVFDGLKSLEYRGYDSWGVAVASSGKIFVKKKAGKIGDSNVNDLPSGGLAIGHTRWATHGGVTDINAHPHLDCSGEIAVIHNGIFENYLEIKKSLIKKGHKFISETDTEVIPHMLEDTSFIKVFRRMEGLNAVIAITAGDQKILAARNGSPLIIGFGKDENFLASDASALLPYTKDAYFLGDSEMAVITDKEVSVFRIENGKKIKFKTQRLNWNIAQGEKGKYPFFMLKEIYEQPRVVADIVANFSEQAQKLAKLIKHSRGIYLLGCGTASYAALAGEYLFSKIAKCHVNFSIGSEFGYHLNFLNNKSLVAAISQSGETMDILESVKKAKERGAKIVCLTNGLGSSLYRMSNYKMLIGAGLEKAVASTKAFSGMIAHLVLTAYAYADSIADGQKVLTKAILAVKDILNKKNIGKIKILAKKIINEKHVYVIGRGISYPTSLEAALKIKEISYIHAEGLAAGELKHGPLALVEKGTPCVAFLPNDETYGANLAGAMEMRARGGFIIGVSFKPHEVFDSFIPVNDAGVATIIPNVVVGQLLAYYLAIGRGLDPDKPRNLAKSVTVK